MGLPPQRDSTPPATAVIGGGLAGLAAAATLLHGGDHVCLFEASHRLGGQVETEVVDGYVVEHGAESFPLTLEAMTVLDTLKIADRPVSQIETATLRWEDGRLIALPRGGAAKVLGIRTFEGTHDGGRLSTYRRGLGTIVSRLADRLHGRVDIRTGNPIAAIRRTNRSWIVETQERNHYAVARVVIAVPPCAAGRLLRPLLPTLADLLDAVPFLSSVSVSLAFPRSAIMHALDATGFVVGGGEETGTPEGLIACTFASSKFPGRAPAGHALLRVFYRPDGGAFPLADPDVTWTGRARADLRHVLRLRVAPDRAWVRRWPAAIPRYPSDHVARARLLCEQLRRAVPMEVAGAACCGVGVLPALESGVRAARRLLVRPARDDDQAGVSHG